ncbi:organic cation transporter protein-like [Montipora foliosa]|uniref:organic cation transporter protein-like n=1 Tax=Montipora foliosa TaxID=591990 RepID=UPI0035F18356
MALSVDDVMEEIGSLQRYQYRLLFVFGFMKIFGDAFQIMIPTFLSVEPPWRCKDNSTVCNITGIFKPGDDSYNYRCAIPRDQWEFDTRELNSVVTEFDLVCKASAFSVLNKSIMFLGYMIGVLVGGVLSDKFGRKPIVYFLSVLCNVLALGASFVRVYWLYVAIRCLIGVCVGSSSLSMFVLLVEYVGKRHRHVVGTSLWYFFALSLMLLSLFGYLIRDWRTLSTAGAVPGLLQIFFWWFIPESPRWLLVHNKPKEAWEELQKVATFNKKEMPDGELDQKMATLEERTGDFRDLFISLNMTKRTLISWFCWLVISLVYYAVSYSSGTFGGNRYLVFFLTSLVEIPANWTCIFLNRKIGRKKTTVIGVVVSCIASVVAVLFQQDLENTGFLVANIIMAQGVAKFFISMAFSSIYVYSCELFPTVIRNIGMGTSSAAARIGSMSAPYIVWLVRVHILLPYSIVAILAFICSALCFLLPETRDTATLENVNSLINNNNNDDQSTELTEKKPDSCEQSKEGDEKVLLNQADCEA